MCEKTENASSGVRQTDIYLSRSKTGKGLNIEGVGSMVLTVSVHAVMNIIDGKTDKTQFSLFRGPSANHEPIDV